MRTTTGWSEYNIQSVHLRTDLTMPSSPKNSKKKDQQQIYLVEVPPDSIHQLQDLVFSLKYFLIFGRILGIIPLIGLTKGQTELIKFRWYSFAVFMNITLLLGLTFSIGVGIVGFFKHEIINFNQLADSVGFFFFYGTGFFIYLYFLLYSKDFIHLLRKWKSIRLYYPCIDKQLRRDAHLIAGFIFVSIILENVTWHMTQFTHPKNRKMKLMNDDPDVVHDSLDFNITQPHNISREIGSLELWYHVLLFDWKIVLPYHPAIVIFGIFFNKIGLYAWNYFDIFIIIISRALYMKYKLLNKAAEKSLLEFGHYGNSLTYKWKQLISDHLTLTNLLCSINEFLSPIILVSYGANIHDLCTHLYNGLSRNANPCLIGSVYAVWSFTHLSLRLFLVSYSAAKINEHALNICKILRKCPIEHYTKEVKKFEIQLFHVNLGLGAFGCFTMTKPFMLKILGVIFTIEIVLLQQNSAPRFLD